MYTLMSICKCPVLNRLVVFFAATLQFKFVRYARKWILSRLLDTEIKILIFLVSSKHSFFRWDINPYDAEAGTFSRKKKHKINIMVNYSTDPLQRQLISTVVFNVSQKGSLTCIRKYFNCLYRLIVTKCRKLKCIFIFPQIFQGIKNKDTRYENSMSKERLFHFTLYWPYVMDFSLSLVNSPQDGPVNGALMFLWY